MAKGGKKAHLARVLDSHVRSLHETFQMLDNSAAASSLEKVEWSRVTKLGDAISKQATIAGMLWSGEAPEVKQLEESMEVYCNILHGFLLLCHGSMVCAGPTLHASIVASAKQVIDSSLTLLKEAVSSCDSHNSDKRPTIPQLSGVVSEACTALKKTPTTNCTAIGRAITQVAVSVKDVLREMSELKAATVAVDPPNDTADEEDASSSEDGDFGSDLSPEEMGIAQLAISVASGSLDVIKEVIRFVSSLVKNSKRELDSKEVVDSLERLLSCCQEMASQVNELGASVYPPQEISEMKVATKKIGDVVEEISAEAESIGGLREGLITASKVLESSLRKLAVGLGADLAPEISRLAL